MIERDRSLEDNETNHKKAVSMDLERLPMLLCGGDEAQADDNDHNHGLSQATLAQARI